MLFSFVSIGYRPKIERESSGRCTIKGKYSLRALAYLSSLEPGESTSAGGSMSTTPDAGRDRSTAPPPNNAKKKKPAPPSTRHTISAGAIPSAGPIRQPLAKG
jgi:hypothetical protein